MVAEGELYNNFWKFSLKGGYCALCAVNEKNLNL